MPMSTAGFSSTSVSAPNPFTDKSYLTAYTGVLSTKQAPSVKPIHAWDSSSTFAVSPPPKAKKQSRLTALLKRAFQSAPEQTPAARAPSGKDFEKAFGELQANQGLSFGGVSIMHTAGRGR
jgi:hypothetical protein